MLFDICVIFTLFFFGLFFAEVLIILGLKLPIKSKVINTCLYCNHDYKWYELIPLISYFTSKGRCNYCHKKLDFYYFLLELILGLLFSLSYIRYGFSYEMLTCMLISSLCVIIFVTDFNYYIILDSSLIISSLLILLFKFLFFGTKTLLISIISGIILFIFMLIIGLIGKVIFKRESLGGGDIKLAAFFGFTLGIRLSIISLILGSLLAFPYAIYLALSNKSRELPFGPYLITALLLIFIFMKKIKIFLSIIFY